MCKCSNKYATKSAWHDTDELTQNFLSGLPADARLKVQCCFRSQAPNNELMEMNSRPLSTIRWTDRTWLQLSAGLDVITLQDFSFFLCVIWKCILCFRPGPPYLEFLAGQRGRGRMLSYLFFCESIQGSCQEFSWLCPGCLGDWEQTLLLLITAVVYGFPLLVMSEAAPFSSPISSQTAFILITHWLLKLSESLTNFKKWSSWWKKAKPVII